MCRGCHEKIHKGKLKTKMAGYKKKYSAVSALNQAMPYIYRELVKIFGEGHVHICSGYETKLFREKNGIEKDHSLDALCIAAIGAGLASDPKDLSALNHCFEIVQYRRHDRQIVRKQSERTYYLDGEAVCKNRHARFEQKGDSLEEFRQKYPARVSQLKVKKSTRSYNNPDRLMPGAVFLYQGERHVLTGTKNLGTRFMYRGCSPSGVNAKDCQIIRKNTGLVYMS